MSFEKSFYNDAVDLYAEIGDTKWVFSECEVVLSKSTTPDHVKFVAIPENPSNLPQKPPETVDRGGLVGETFKLYASSDLRDVQDYRIFTGRLSNLSNTILGAYDGTAHDKTHYKLAPNDPSSIYNEEIDISKAVTDQRVENDEVKGDVVYDIPSTQTKIYQIDADELARYILEQVGISDYELVLSEDGTELGKGQIVGRDTYMAFSSQRINAGDLLERIKESTNSEWWFDRFGKFYLGAPTRGRPIDLFDIKFITETSAGLTTPPYQSVQVIGSGVVSEDGWQSQAVVEDAPFKTRKDVFDSDRDTDGLQKPTFTYRNMSIQTQEEAENVRKKLISKIRKQSAKGTITIVGDPRIRPHDTVTMPNTEEQPFGKQTFGVYKVTHRFKDGFETKINVSGLTLDEEAVYVTSDKFSKLEDRYARRAANPADFNRQPDASYDPVEDA